MPERENDESLRQAQAVSDAFVGALVHELRNSLSSIVTSGTLLELKPDDPAVVRKRARAILRASWRMERLIQNVLAFTVARAKGAISVSLADADLSTIAHHFVADLEATVAERIRFEETGDSKGRWDPERMAQLLSNLVDNAIEHGEPKAPIVISIDGSAKDRVLLAIRNGGVIAETELEGLFSPFKRNSQSRRGMGLGLTIASFIARAHGGEISVRSNAAEGTTFELRLPRYPTLPADDSI